MLALAAGSGAGHIDRGLIGLRFVVRAAVPGERLYCTGDLGCFRGDGTIEEWKDLRREAAEARDRI